MPKQLVNPKKSNYQESLAKMFGYLINGFWMFAPTEIQKILMRGFTMVLPEYRRKGMAQHLLHYEISDDKLKVKSYSLLLNFMVTVG